MVNHSDETKDEIVQLIKTAMKLSEDEDKLEEEIKTWKEVLEHTNLNEDFKAISLRSLGLAILFRYKTSKNPSDLDQTIAYFLECVKVLDSTDSEYCSDPEIFREVYDRMGEAYTYKFDQSNDMSDLNYAIDYVGMALENSEKQDTYHIEIVLELMRLLVKRYFEVPDENKSVEDLDKAIELGENIITVFPEGSKYLSFVMHALSKSYLQKRSLTNEEEDLENAITALVKLTSVVSHDDPRFGYGTVMLKFLHKSYPDAFSKLKINLIDTEDVSVIQEIYDLLHENKLKEAIVRVEDDLSKFPDDNVLLLFHRFLHAAFNGNPVCEQILNQIKESDPGKERLMGLISSSEYSWNQKQGLRKLQGIPEHIDISQIKINAENEAMSHILRGQLYQQKEDLLKAIGEYSKAINLDQTNEIFYLNRGGLYSEIGKDDLAIKDLSKAIQLNPNLINAYFNRGEAKRTKGDYAGAIKDFSKGIELDPHDFEFYVRRALAYSGIKKFYLAINDCNKVIKNDPQNDEAIFLRGETYYRIGEYEKAIADLSKGLELDPNFLEGRRLRGNAYITVGKLEKALGDFTYVTSIDPDNAYAHSKCGEIHLTKSDFQNAVENFTRVIELDPENYQAYANRGICFSELGFLEKAEIDCLKALQINDKDPQVRFNLGIVQMKAGNHKGAIDAFSQEIELDPDNSHIFLLRASLNKILGDEKAAEKDIKTAAKLSGEDEDKLRRKYLTNSKNEEK